MDAHYRFIGNVGNTCYLETDHHASRGSIVAVDLASPKRKRFRVILPEQQERIAFSTVAGGHLLVGFLHHVCHRMALYALDGTFVRELALPPLGAINGIWAQSRDPEVFLSWESFLCPPTIYRYDIQTEQLTLLRVPQIPFNASRYETVQVFYPSQDGTPIPMFVTQKKGRSASGTTPTLLYAYGGFGVSITPAFWLSQLCWLEQGGTFAVANIRGGGEYGETWHRAAVCWVDTTVPDAERYLRTATRVLGEAAGREPLTMLADDHTLWAWLSSAGRPTVDVKLLNDKLAGTATVHVALGELASGLAGFRSSHRDALRARTVAEAGLHTAPSVVEFEHIAIAALMSDNLEDLRRWVTRTLGELARDDESMARLRETVRVFLQCGGSYTDAAALLHLHKNTVNYRARKAEEAIGHPLTERRLDLEVALLVADVLGVRVDDPS